MIKKKIRIIGVGNPLMGDDGVGVETVHRLSQLRLPEGIEVIDGGTAGLSLLPYLEEVDAVIFVDAVDAGEAPGTVMRVSTKDILDSKEGNHSFSLHEPAIPDLLRLAAELDICPPTLLIGIQVDSVSPRIGLSFSISRNLDSLVSFVLDEARSLISAT